MIDVNKKKQGQPRLGRWLLAHFTNYEEDFSGSGDFGEEFAERERDQGRGRALRWYWPQVVHALWLDFVISLWFGGVMFNNFMKTAWRNIKRQKLYSVINITGLALGLVVCILMVQYIRYEMTFDDFHEKAGQIYRVNAHDLGRDLKFAATQALLASTLKEDFPEVSFAARVKRWSGYFKYQDRMFTETRFLCADPDFKDIFTFPLTAGDAGSLDEPFALFITEEMADKYFRGENPLGKTLSLDNRHDFIIRGILQDIPENSYLQFDLLTSMATLNVLWGERWLNRWVSHDFNTFVLLEPQADPVVFKEKLGAFIRPPDQGKEETMDVYYPQPMKKIHLGAGLRSELGETNDIRYIYILSATVFFIMLIACFNYITLATARAARRTREIGLRKVVGAGRMSLVRQFLGESVLFTLLAFILAVLAVNLLLPWFNRLMNRPLTFSAAEEMPLALLLSLFLGLAAGLYPALYLSSFQPTRLLRGGGVKDSGPSSFMRRSLVVLQFTITIGLITSLLMVRNQIQYLTKNSLGDFENVVVTVNLNDPALRFDHDSLYRAFRENPQVLDGTVSYSHPLHISWGMGMAWEDKEKSQFVRLGPVDFNYIDFYGLKVLEGRKMLEKMGTDRAEAVLLNQTAARASPWENPIGKRCRVDGQPGIVIGIVQDFHFKPLYNQVEPLAIRHLYREGFVGGAGIISLKISTGDIPGTLKALEGTWKKYSSFFPFQFSFLDETIDTIYRTEIRLSRSLTSFTMVAIFLSGLGLFGLTSFSAERRRKEIGIRKVLGSSTLGIFLLLARDLLKMLVLAAAVALPLAYCAMGQWLERFAYRIDFGLETYVLALAFSLLVAFLAMGGQSIKVARSNPVHSLRHE